MLKALAYYSYILAALSVALRLLEKSANGSETPLWPTIVVAALFLLAGRLLTALADSRQQAGRDRRASALFASLVDNESGEEHVEPYALYLRPFSTTGRMIVSNPKMRWLPVLPSYFATEETLEFETLLAEALAPDLPLIALGRPGEHIGAGRLAVADEEWQDVFQRLIQHASWIVMIPNDEGETRWEIEQLVTQGLLHKTLFIMPPMLRSRQPDAADYWEKVRSGLAGLSLQLPRYNNAGQLFRLGQAGQYYRGRHLPKLTLPLVRDRFAGLTTEPGKNG
jgi:hypothetical protein